MQEINFSKEIEQYIATVRRLSSKDGYFERFYEILADKKMTHEEAMEQVEYERSCVGLPRRYSSIYSFHFALYAYLNKTNK